MRVVVAVGLMGLVGLLRLVELEPHRGSWTRRLEGVVGLVGLVDSWTHGLVDTR